MQRIVLGSTFPIYPPLGGGKIRLFNLFKALPNDFETYVVSLTLDPRDIKDREISPRLHETTIKASRLHAKLEEKIYLRLGVPITDSAATVFIKLTPEYRKVLSRHDDANVIVASHPYLLNELLRIRKRQILVYEAQDVEYLLKKGFYPATLLGRYLLRVVRKIEKKCCRLADLIICVTEKDREDLINLYNLESDKVKVVANGVDCSAVTYRTERQISDARKKLEIDRPSAVFIGSIHPPNIEAVETIMTIAEELIEIDFHIVGSVCSPFEERVLPTNCRLWGVVDETLKTDIYRAVDIALNPISSGSGSNLKLVEYFAVGLPCVTTIVGARGFDIIDGEHAIVSDIDGFKQHIRHMMANPREMDEMAKRARNLVASRYDWRRLAEKYSDFINEKMTKDG